MVSKRVLAPRIGLRLSLLSAASLAALIGVAPAQSLINGFNGGTDFTVNGDASFPSQSTLNITTDVYGEANSVYYNSLVDADAAFDASFIYTLAAYPQGDGFSPADGFTFLLQDDPRGTAALGNAGGNLGYADIGAISPSVALAFNIYSQHTIGTALLTDGNNPENYSPTPGANLVSGDPIWIRISYSDSTLTETLTDLTLNTGCVFNYSINIPNVLGSGTAYVGFTGGDASGTSLQQISNFQFDAVPEPSALGGLGTCLIGLTGVGWRRKRRRNAK